MGTTARQRRLALPARFFPGLLGALIGLWTFSAAAGADPGSCGGGGCCPRGPHGSWTEAMDEALYPTQITHYVEVKPGVYLAVRGPSERRRVRLARWAAVIGGDRQAVYQMLGYPPQRHRENFMDVVTEFWTYPGEYVTFVFEGDRLLRTETY